MAGRPSGIARKFLIDAKAWEEDPNHDYNAFRKQYYFFYGRLMVSTTLAKVLQLRSRPQFCPAKVVGYSCMRLGSVSCIAGWPSKGDSVRNGLRSSIA